MLLPDWFAVTTTVPTPVIVRVFPLTVAGPVALNVTGNPELAVADKVIGATPFFTELGGAVKLIV